MTTIKQPQERLNVTPKKFRRGKRIGSNVATSEASIYFNASCIRRRAEMKCG
jgi:hypothetical protein